MDEKVCRELMGILSHLLMNLADVDGVPVKAREAMEDGVRRMSKLLKQQQDSQHSGLSQLKRYLKGEDNL